MTSFYFDILANCQLAILNRWWQKIRSLASRNQNFIQAEQIKAFELVAKNAKRIHQWVVTLKKISLLSKNTIHCSKTVNGGLTIPRQIIWQIAIWRMDRKEIERLLGKCGVHAAALLGKSRAWSSPAAKRTNHRVFESTTHPVVRTAWRSYGASWGMECLKLRPRLVFWRTKTQLIYQRAPLRRVNVNSCRPLFQRKAWLADLFRSNKITRKVKRKQRGGWVVAGRITEIRKSFGKTNGGQWNRQQDTRKDTMAAIKVYAGLRRSISGQHEAKPQTKLGNAAGRRGWWGRCREDCGKSAEHTDNK